MDPFNGIVDSIVIKYWTRQARFVMTKSNGHQQRMWSCEDEHVMGTEPILDCVESLLLLCPRRNQWSQW